MKYQILGKKQIKGVITSSGSKNATLPLIAACLLSKDISTLYNVPLISDVIWMLRILDEFGAYSFYDYKLKKLIIKRRKIKKVLLLPYFKVLRASYYFIPILIHLKKEFKIYAPGGCKFSERPIDYHIAMFKQMGISVDEADTLTFKVKKLKPISFNFPKASVGATINGILSLVLVDGTSYLHNASKEPEVKEVINFLNKMGAKIEMVDRTIKIEGVKSLSGAKHEIMPDRIEVASYMLLTLSHPNSEITIKKVKIEHLEKIITLVKELGAEVLIKENEITVYSKDQINSFNLKIGPYPMIPTDLQPILSALALFCKTKSKIDDFVYPGRITHVNELKKLNADINVFANRIIINPSTLKPQTVTAQDLRCGFALILALSNLEKEAIIENAECILRGYEDISEKLLSLGIIYKKLP